MGQDFDFTPEIEWIKIEFSKQVHHVRTNSREIRSKNSNFYCGATYLLEIAKVRNRRLVVGNTLNVLSRIHDNCGPPDLEVKCSENEQCGKWNCQMLRDKMTCDVTCDTGCKYS